MVPSIVKTVPTASLFIPFVTNVTAWTGAKFAVILPGPFIVAVVAEDEKSPKLIDPDPVQEVKV